MLLRNLEIFHRAINVEPDFAETIIKTCCLLHNFVRERDGVKFKDTLTVRGFAEGMPVDNCNPGNNARCTRAILTDYFMNEGHVHTQHLLVEWSLVYWVVIGRRRHRRTTTPVARLQRRVKATI
ncbi:hypothetical protein PR048_006066 [Dryococelus australis]|uniref:DDE Tnp4 domain-containing protein n=1 Tax=Dryococelus australis TaxID=614101 RepID=A0ABQ9IC39_9NEOP|nr:hypothetical protein PR048_006066 [Dryococelus australis]